MANKRDQSKTSLSNPGVHRYALAFYRGIQDERLEPIMAEYRMVLELFKAYPDLEDVLNHIVLNDEEKDRILSKVLETCMVSKEMSSFLKSLVRRRHVDWLSPIFDSMHILINRQNKKEVAFVKAAVKLNEVQRDNLRKKLESLSGKKIEMNLEIDPDIKGGITARVGDRIFDTSLKGKLAAMCENMSV